MADGAPSRTLAWFERQLNSRKAEPVTDDRTTLAMLSEQLADAVSTAGAALVAVHARPRLPSTGVHWKDGVVVTTEGTIRREDDIAVTLPDGRHIPATLAGRDPGTHPPGPRIAARARTEEHTAETPSPPQLACRLLLVKKKNSRITSVTRRTLR